MSDEEWCKSIYPDAYLDYILDDYEDGSGGGFLILQSPIYFEPLHHSPILFFNSQKAAWKDAVKYINDIMLEKLES